MIKLVKIKRDKRGRFASIKKPASRIMGGQFLKGGPNKEREVAMLLSTGFYPAFGKNPKLLFNMQVAKARQTYIRAPGYTTFIHNWDVAGSTGKHLGDVLGNFSKTFKTGIPKKGSRGKVKGMPGTLLKMAPAESRIPTQPFSKESFQAYFRERIFHKASAINLLGNFVWYQGGLSPTDATSIAGGIFDELFTGNKQNAILAQQLAKTNNNILEAQKLMLDDFFEKNYAGYTEVEQSTLKKKAHRLASSILKGRMLLSKDDLIAVTEEQLDVSKADMSEEDYDNVNQQLAAIFSGTKGGARQGVSAPGKSIWAANKLDMKGWIEQGKKRHDLVYDVTVSEIMKGAKTGEHGVGRVLRFDETLQKKEQETFEWVKNNTRTVKGAVENFFEEEIKVIFNPVIEGLKKAAGVTGSEKDVTREDIKRDFETVYQNRSKYVEMSKNGQGALEASKLLGDDARKVLEKYVSGIGGYATEKGKGGKEGKLGTLLGYIFHNIMNIPNMYGNTFFQSHPISKKSSLGNTWYAAVPMEMITKGPNVYEFNPKSPSEFTWPLKTLDPATHTESNEVGTLILSGPNMSMALWTKYGNLMPVQAAKMAVEQAITNQLALFHTKGERVDGPVENTVMSLCDAVVTDNTLNHATSVTYLPNFLPEFFSNIVKHIGKDFDEKELKGLVGEHLTTAQEQSPGSSTFDHFWALPYVSTFDTLERSGDDVHTYLSGIQYEGGKKSWVSASPYLSKERGFGRI